eukprot:CAMPEP_0170526344 /NCGR_PEP_ID=MMETSP0209-20121228/11786_1 /TAXON_ID=665100 ORGANISM="Litonotus pictus, Strain P1" /NCGR_SAMPLE_ID=MMETSP0209 /ASSEMBLY_ACC=CAM_ASM_000301 /LENGTH=609 /DNA_ID=CAMNT_0010816121 /DNA_START=313 /DNA_END=2139 /DNA_ORIENTATION=-
MNKEDVTTLLAYFTGHGLAKPMKKKNRLREKEDLYKKNLMNDGGISHSETTINFIKSTNNLDKSRLSKNLNVSNSYHNKHGQGTSNTLTNVTLGGTASFNNKEQKTGTDTAIGTANETKQKLRPATTINFNSKLEKKKEEERAMLEFLDFEKYKDDVEEKEEDYNDDKVMLIKKYRKMFEEREKDKAEKDQAEKDVKEKMVEIEKNKKKFLEEMTKRPISLNYEGQVIKLKAINQERLGKHALALDTVKLPLSEEQELEKINKELKKNNNNLNALPGLKPEKEDIVVEPSVYDPKKETNIVDFIKKKTQINEEQCMVLKYGPTEVELPVNYFQPDPMVFYEFSDGVNFEFYGKKKEGKTFPSLPNQMNKAEFNTLLTMYNRKLGVMGDDMVGDIDMTGLPKKETYSNMSSYATEKSEENELSATRRKLNNAFSDEIAEEENQNHTTENKGKEKKHKNKPKSKYDTVTGMNDMFKYTNLASASRLYEIKKRQKMKKREEMKSLVKKDDKNFNLDRILPNTDDRVYEAFNDQNDNGSMLIANGTKPIPRMPKKVHINDLAKINPRKRTHKQVKDQYDMDVTQMEKIKEKLGDKIEKSLMTMNQTTAKKGFK